MNNFILDKCKNCNGTGRIVYNDNRYTYASDRVCLACSGAGSIYRQMTIEERLDRLEKICLNK